MLESDGYCPIKMWNEPEKWHYCTDDEAVKAGSIGLLVERKKQKPRKISELFDPGPWYIRPVTRENVDRLYEICRPQDWKTVTRYLKLGARNDARLFVDFALHFDRNALLPDKKGFFGRAFTTGGTAERVSFSLERSVDTPNGRKAVRWCCAAYAIAREVDIITRSDNLPFEVSIYYMPPYDGPDILQVEIKNLDPPGPEYL